MKHNTAKYTIEFIFDDIIIIRYKNEKKKNQIALLSNLDRIIELGQLANYQELQKDQIKEKKE